MDYEPLEDYSEISAEPMEWDLYYDWAVIAKAAAEGKLRVLPPDCELDPAMLKGLGGPLDTTCNQIIAAIVLDCQRRFPEDKTRLMARRFLARFFAVGRAVTAGLLDDWFIQLEKDAEPILAPAVQLAASVSPLQSDGTFEPEEYLENIRECQKVIEEVWPDEDCGPKK